MWPGNSPRPSGLTLIVRRPAGSIFPRSSPRLRARGREIRDRPNGGPIARLKDPWFCALLGRRIGNVPRSAKTKGCSGSASRGRAGPGVGIGGRSASRPGGWARRRPDPGRRGDGHPETNIHAAPHAEPGQASDSAKRRIFPLPHRGVRSRQVGANFKAHGCPEVVRVPREQGTGDADRAT